MIVDDYGNINKKRGFDLFYNNLYYFTKDNLQRTSVVVNLTYTWPLTVSIRPQRTKKTEDRTEETETEPENRRKRTETETETRT